MASILDCGRERGLLQEGCSAMGLGRVGLGFRVTVSLIRACTEDDGLEISYACN